MSTFLVFFQNPFQICFLIYFLDNLRTDSFYPWKLRFKNLIPQKFLASGFWKSNSQNLTFTLKFSVFSVLLMFGMYLFYFDVDNCKFNPVFLVRSLKLSETVLRLFIFHSFRSDWSDRPPPAIELTAVSFVSKGGFSKLREVMRRFGVSSTANCSRAAIERSQCHVSCIDACSAARLSQCSTRQVSKGYHQLWNSGGHGRVCISTRF